MLWESHSKIALFPSLVSVHRSHIKAWHEEWASQPDASPELCFRHYWGAVFLKAFFLKSRTEDVAKCTVRVVTIHRGEVILIFFLQCRQVLGLLEWLKQEASCCAVKLITKGQAWTHHDIIKHNWGLIYLRTVVPLVTWGDAKMERWKEGLWFLEKGYQL